MISDRIVGTFIITVASQNESWDDLNWAFNAAICLYHKDACNTLFQFSFILHKLSLTLLFF